ncbi:hypothetical protein [Sphingobium sp. YG1]|uniref:hypothetical protein n=1 Tax=Sphingobium sp. YG1 TaxID=2082188 RepID=UPI000DBBAC3F|nr:hypothetical protein [Sphingobium sp. YG1]BBC99094.1 hypothetical protein YGS_C1P0350 [Sphingobium sp. YG1]
MVDKAVAAVGSLVSGAASYEAGKYNKRVAEQNAISSLREGAAEEARIREVARAQIGEQVAAQGASGFQMGTGSALDALSESQINATLDALNARREAASRAQGYRVQGAQAMSAGKNAYTAGMFQAASTVLDYKADWAQASSGRSSSSGSGGIVTTGGSRDAVSRAFAKVNYGG